MGRTLAIVFMASMLLAMSTMLAAIIVIRNLPGRACVGPGELPSLMFSPQTEVDRA